MKVEFDAQSHVESIVKELGSLEGLTEKAETKAMTEIKKVILKHLKIRIPKEFDKIGNRSNYDGSRPYVEMVDDIKASVTRKDGTARLIVRGGKYTGYKWHLLDDGTLGRPGTNFTRLTMKDADAEIDALIDRIIREVTNGR